ncbi:CgeB family protein [Geotalea toluenoxydans]
MMRIVMFYHSIISDWNHGNAHFLRGIVTELLGRGHQVEVYEPKDGWSLTNLLREQGEIAIRQFRRMYPLLDGKQYVAERLNLDRIFEGADLVIVHEWNDHEVVRKIGEHRKRNGHYHLLFHDTHHRSVTDYDSMSAYDLSGYDGVLAYGTKIRDIYLKSGWTKRGWVWHEAADIQVFQPHTRMDYAGDVVWIGNWGDEERSEEICEFFVEPVKRLKLKGMVYGVRYPEKALKYLAKAGIEYGGWLPNFDVPKVFNRYRMTMHIPRRPYATALPGIPTIRPFEALACGIPLISAPWVDCDELFTAGEDLLYAQDGFHMERQMKAVLDQPLKTEQMVNHGLKTIRERHTCSHRVDELLRICTELGMDTSLPRNRKIGGKG